MKTRQLTILLSFIILLPFTGNSQSDDYSIKNRWTAKASISTYKMTDISPNSLVGFNRDTRKVDFKLEGNYGINKFVEIGVYIGAQMYGYTKWREPTFFYPYESDTTIKWMTQGGDGKLAFAPLFGININFHVLPFIVKAETCPWDLYFTAKYGGNYIIHRENEYTYVHVKSKYRHEYGLGLGAGYYFRNKVGIFAEYYIGECSDPSSEHLFAGNNFRFRFGITSKFGK